MNATAARNMNVSSSVAFPTAQSSDGLALDAHAQSSLLSSLAHDQTTATTPTYASFDYLATANQNLSQNQNQNQTQLLSNVFNVTPSTSTISIDQQANTTYFWPSTTAVTDVTLDVYSAQYWLKQLITFLVDAIKVIYFLKDNLDKLLVYLIVSITSSLIIVLVGVTVKIIMARNAKHRQKQSHYAAEGEYMEISISHSRKQVDAACSNGRHTAVHVHSKRQQLQSQSQSQSATNCAKQRTHTHTQRRRSGNKSSSSSKARNAVNEEVVHSSRTAASAKGLDRVRNQEYVQPPRVDSKRKRASTLPSPPHTTSKRNRNQAGAVTFSQSISDATRPILRGELIPSQNFQVVRFQPQFSNKFSSAQLTSSFHDDNFEDFGE